MRSRSSSRPRPVKLPRTSAVALLIALLVPAAAWALEFRSVAVPRAVLYDAPSAQANKQFVVSQYYPVEVIVDLGGWLKVRDVKGGLAWIEASQLAARRTVLVTAAEAHVLDKPAADGRPVEFGEVLLVVE